ncbi:di-trans,poly-cis-decaprenylcistransferase [candidate division WWE3 bacterium]|uniref:Isoprenyl transferase n=1 Tax=candidate division WWE3 bacterium TaxID=2053526 RepID=A0A955RQJ5_UNCKA|nr:di-trans,poly-cis-decaprenylcistransferase [candidate division WWE3 bacterium]
MPKYNESIPTLPDDIQIPKHVAFSPNGNRRWAKEKGLHTLEGHKAGAQAMLRLIEAGYDYGIHTMTFWGFSTENWKRTQEEVGYLMKLFEFLHEKHQEEVLGRNVRVIHLGRKDRLPDGLAKKIAETEELSKNQTEHVLNIAVDYGGHDELLRAMTSAFSDIQKGLLTVDDLSEIVGWYVEDKVPYHRFKDYLDTTNQPHPFPDIVVRTSGDKRTSGFLPWQSIYAEYIWLEEHFPDLSAQHLHDILLSFNNRERRFGGDAQ